MSSKQKWRIIVRDMETRLSIGIHEHERTPQRVLVNAVVEADYAVHPSSIDECFNYEHIHQLVTQEWPKHPHVDLLESRVTELLEYIFRKDSRVTYAKVSVAKPDVYPDAEAVAVEAEWTREDFRRLME